MQNPNTYSGTTGAATGASRSESGERPMVTALFADRASAERAYEALTARGYDTSDVNIVMSEDTRKSQFDKGAETELGNKAAKGAGVGGAIGGTVGAIAAALAAVGSNLVLPGLGLVVAGPLAAGLAGAGAGAATGGIVGALVGAGIPEERVKRYQEGIKQGGILLGVRPRSEEDADYLTREWASMGAEKVSQ